MRRWRLILVVAWLLAMAGTTTAVLADHLPPGGTFVDDNGSVHEGFIEAIAAEEITVGCNPPVNDMYCPDDLVTRAQMATFLARALGLAPSDVDEPFTDHLASVHRQNINAVRDAEITVGCNPPVNDMYCPDDFVTRAQMATFLARALGLAPSDDDGAFIDHLASVHRQNINAVRIAGITVGCNPPDNDMYCPDDFVTRAQMATFLGRALGLGAHAPPPPTPTSSTSSTSSTMPGEEFDVAGSWSGTTSQDMGISFEVVNPLTTLTVAFHIDGFGCSQDTEIIVDFATPLPIVNNTFTWQSDDPFQDRSFEVVGTFTSDTQATGTLFMEQGPNTIIPVCPGVAEGTWEAEKQ